MRQADANRPAALANRAAAPGLFVINRLTKTDYFFYSFEDPDIAESYNN